MAEGVSRGNTTKGLERSGRPGLWKDANLRDPGMFVVNDVTPIIDSDARRKVELAIELHPHVVGLARDRAYRFGEQRFDRPNLVRLKG